MDMTCSFRVGAVLRTSMAAVRASLSGMGALESHGKISCDLASSESHHCSAEFYGDCVIVRMDFGMQEPRLYNESLASLLALTHILQADYEFDMWCIYGHIIEALRNNWQFSIRNQDQVVASLKREIEGLGRSNAALSSAVVELSCENARLLAQAAPMKEFCAALFMHSKRHGAAAGYLEAIAKEFGIDPELPGRVAASLE